MTTYHKLLELKIAFFNLLIIILEEIIEDLMELQTDYKIVLYNVGTGVKTYSDNKRKIVSKLSTSKWISGPFSLKVTYSNGLTNEGIYKTKEETLVALNAFTEKLLIDYIKGVTSG